MRCRPPGGKHDALAVGRPSLDDVGAGVPRQALRLAAVVGRGCRVGRHDVHVGVAAVLGAEGDPLAVGGELRVLGFALEAREAPRRAAGAVDDPDIVRVGERNVLFADGGAAQHAGLRGGGRG